MQLRLWEQEGTLWRRKFTDTMYEVTCKGFVGEGGNAEAHLVQLDNVQLCTQPATAAADNSEGRMVAAAAVAAAPQAAAAAACRTGNQPLRSPEVGGLYVLKLCRQLQDLTAEERGNVAVDDMRSYRNAARKQLLGVRARYGRLAGSPCFVRCFAYGTAQVVVPGAAAAPPRSEQERPCLLLEYAQGGSVAALLQSPEGGPAGMSEQHAFEVMRAAAAALQECHRKRIINRSVHPGNIVKAQAPSGREVFKMINCGSSTTMDEGLGSGYRFGMWAYRAPEQRAGVYHHYTLDTWHLGCLLLHLRTGVCLLLVACCHCSCISTSSTRRSRLYKHLVLQLLAPWCAVFPLICCFFIFVTASMCSLHNPRAPAAVQGQHQSLPCMAAACVAAALPTCCAAASSNLTATAAPAGELSLPELLGLPGEEWLAKVSAVHSDIMHCEQHPYLQRYSSLSLQERELLSKCLIPDANEQPMVERVYDSCNYFAREGLALGGDALLNLASHLASAVARRLVGELYGNNQQGEV